MKSSVLRPAVVSVAKELLAWFAQNQRPLPWRTAQRDPYAVWVSEVMLQQTRVETVLKYYAPFLKQFPDAQTLAAASEDSLMKAWEGLGYYRRARLLHAGARALDGAPLPDTYEELLALPGFGPYTAGAVASLAFGRAVPAVDGNVLRVVSRLTTLDLDVGTPAARRAVDAWVRAHQPAEAPGAFNEALMELGATICKPRQADCGACPLAAICAAHLAGDGAVERYPVKARPTPARPMRVALALARRAGGRVLLEKRDAGLLAGTWGLPWVEIEEGEDATDKLSAHVAALTGGRTRVASEPTARGTHVFTHRRWAMEAYLVDIEGDGGEWHVPARMALGTAHRRMLDATR